MDWMPRDPAAFWTMIGAIAIPMGALLSELYRRLRNILQAELGPLKEQNEWLKTQIEQRLQLPTFAMNAVELTEKSAQLRIEELKREHEQALRSRDEAKSGELASAVQELETLKKRLQELNAERNRIVHRVEGVLRAREPVDSTNGFGLPTGPILLVRQDGKVGALKAIDQASDRRGKFIRYAWWFIPDGSTDFSSPDTEFGFGETGEHVSTNPQLTIGPISVTWSMGGDGLGWVYYGTTSGSPDYELAITQEADISRVDASHYRFFKHPRYREA